MPHWLAVAEREQELKTSYLVCENEAADEKLFKISENYQANKEAYEGFINILSELCRRVNNLASYEDRISVVAAYETHSYSFSSCMRHDRIVPAIFHPFVKRLHYRYEREIVFSPSETLGCCKLATRSERFYKKHQKHSSPRFYFKISYTPYSSAPPRYSTCNIRTMNIETAIKYLDWLAFKQV